MLVETCNFNDFVSLFCSCFPGFSSIAVPCAGSTVRAGLAMGRHVIGLEGDATLFNEVLLPMLPQPEIVEEDRVPSPVSKKRAASPSDSDDDDVVEVKRAPKRTCK